MSNRDFNPTSGQPGVASAAPPVILPASGPEFRRLDARVIKLWRLTYCITAVVLLLVALIAAVAVGAAFPGRWLWPLAGWLTLASLSVWLVLWYPPRAYDAWGYRIDEKVLETHRGIWFRVIQLLPLSRLQHVDLHRGPLERSFGLTTLILHTAGTHHAILAIPGLSVDEALRLRDHLIAAGGDDAV
jgi:hypothetical protein